MLTIKNKCICCGNSATAHYRKGDEFGKCMAESVDVCGKCYEANCFGISVCYDDADRFCRITGKQSIPLFAPPAGGEVKGKL